jgi:hypothetical protein
MSDEIHERVAVLEANYEATVKKLDEAISKLDGINTQLSKYHGFIGAVAFIVTGVGIAWNIFGGWVKTHWQ